MTENPTPEERAERVVPAVDVPSVAAEIRSAVEAEAKQWAALFGVEPSKKDEILRAAEDAALERAAYEVWPSDIEPLSLTDRESNLRSALAQQIRRLKSGEI